MTSTPESTPWEQVLHEYIDVGRKFRLIEDASRMHRDRMLTWAIGLMGGGIFATLHLASEGICSPPTLMWAAAPWSLGVLFAVLGRIASAHQDGVRNLLTAGEAYLIRLQLVKGLDPTSAGELLRRLSDDPSRVQLERKVKCAEKMTSAFYYLTLVSLLLGMIVIFWRVVTC